MPCGIPKLKIAALVVPTLVTVALAPAAKVVVVPASQVAASHSSHFNELLRALLVTSVVQLVSTTGI